MSAAVQAEDFIDTYANRSGRAPGTQLRRVHAHMREPLRSIHPRPDDEERAAVAIAVVASGRGAEHHDG